MADRCFRYVGGIRRGLEQIVLGYKKKARSLPLSCAPLISTLFCYPKTSLRKIVTVMNAQETHMLQAEFKYF